MKHSALPRRLQRTLALAVMSMGAQAAPADALEARVNALSQELRCVVCQNQSVADSQAELAKDMKRQVREQLAAGKADAEVIDFMVQRYGDFVRYRPALRADTALLWLGPGLLLLFGAWTLHGRLRQAGSSAPEPTVCAQQAAHALALLDADDRTP